MKPRLHRRTVLSLASASALFALPDAAWGDEALVVIVHRSNPLSSLSRSQLASLFKAQSTRFPGGDRAKPINLPPGNPVRAAFDKAVLGLDPQQVDRYWIDSKIRTGNGPPPKLPNPSAVVQFVASEVAGVGYVPASHATREVKIIGRVEGDRFVG